VARSPPACARPGGVVGRTVSVICLLSLTAACAGQGAHLPGLCRTHLQRRANGPHNAVLEVRAQSRPSKSKRDRGAVASFFELINQVGEVVMTFKVDIIPKRSPGS
jgi:hypothetical protein